MLEDSPRLLLVAHGTSSANGRATIAAIADVARAARPGTEVDVCFLDVVAPRLGDALDDRPTVVVPVLLSTGYHVQTDIPAAIAGYPATVVAAHLGPDPLIVDALIARTGVDPNGVIADATVLVAAGSSRAEAGVEVAAAAEQVQRRMAELNPRHRTTIATMADDLDAVLAEQPDPFQLALYLLAEGTFVTRIERAARARGLRWVPPPIGAHPKLIGLIWKRYDEAASKR